MSEQGKFGEPWSFDGMGNLIDCHGERIATGYDNGETCINHDDRVRVCINTCAPLGEDPAAEIAAKDARIAELEDALDEISSGESSTYSDDVLTNAKMHIDYVTTLAYAALEKKPC